MISLRRRLTLSLWAALVIVGLAASVSAGLQARGDADALLDYQMEQVAHFLAAQSFSAGAAPPVVPRVDVDHDAEDDFVVMVTAPDGRRLYASREDWALAPPDWLGFREVQVAGVGYRVYAGRSDSTRIMVGQQLQTRREIAENAGLSALLPVLVLIPVMGIIIGMTIRHLLAPLNAVAADVARRPPLSLTPLKADSVPTEIRPLIEEINELLARLSVAMAREQRFITDAAHALRTPLTALQLQADVLEGSHEADERRSRLTELRAGIQRTARLAGHLLTLARTAQSAPDLGARCDVDAALVDLCDVHGRIATVSGQRLELRTATGATVPGDGHMFAVMVGNLIENALRYTPAGGTVVVTATAEASRVMIQVIDEGPGLPPDEQDKVFERFYRARGDTTEGSGLGLAAARGIAESLGGTIGLHNHETHPGLVAVVRLPRATMTPTMKDERS